MISMDKDNGDSSTGKALQLTQESNLQLVPTFKDVKSRILRKQNVLEEDAYIEVYKSVDVNKHWTPVCMDLPSNFSLFSYLPLIISAVVISNVPEL